MSDLQSATPSATGTWPNAPHDQQPCPFCDAIGTLERFARSDWFVCVACTRTLLISSGRLVRRGTIGEPWQASIATFVFCMALLWPSVGSAEMPRLAMRVRACTQDGCSTQGRMSFARQASRHVLELSIARRAENRRLIVALYCDGVLVDGPAEMPHEGELAFPIRTREYRRLPPGHYVAIAMLTTATGQQVRAAPVEFTVMDGVP